MQRRASPTVSATLLRLLALYLDMHDCIVSVPRTMRALAGDPRCRRHRKLIEKFLRERQQLNHAVQNLKRRSYLQKKIFGNTSGFVLTSKGEEKLFRQSLRDTAGRVRLPANQWLMVFFDIPERLKRERDFLRANLRLLEFEPLQKSIWVTRHDVRTELRTIVKTRRLGEYVKLLIVKELGD